MCAGAGALLCLRPEPRFERHGPVLRDADRLGAPSWPGASAGGASSFFRTHLDPFASSAWELLSGGFWELVACRADIWGEGNPGVAVDESDCGKT